MKHEHAQILGAVDRVDVRLAAIERLLTQPRWWTPRTDQGAGFQPESEAPSPARAPTYDERMARITAEATQTAGIDVLRRQLERARRDNDLLREQRALALGELEALRATLTGQ